MWFCIVNIFKIDDLLVISIWLPIDIYLCCLCWFCVSSTSCMLMNTSLRIPSRIQIIKPEWMLLTDVKEMYLKKRYFISLFRLIYYLRKLHCFTKVKWKTCVCEPCIVYVYIYFEFVSKSFLLTVLLYICVKFSH